MNQNTHFLDSSQVYGSDDETAKILRTFSKGALNVTSRKNHHHEMDLLPPDNNSTMKCNLSKAVAGFDPPAHVKCFKAGEMYASWWETLLDLKPKYSNILFQSMNTYIHHSSGCLYFNQFQWNI